jgi:hypothetical protein
MIIHLCQTETTQHVSVLGRVVSAIHDLGYDAGGVWASGELQYSQYDRVQAAAKSIEQSDMLIAEVSGSSTFSTGYEVAYALQSKKPILLLVHEGSKVSSYATGIKNEFVTVHTYTDFTVEKIVKDFIKDNDSKTKDMRFNFVIDRKIYNHLRLKSFRSGKTKAEIVRDLLLKDLEEKS